MAHPPNPHLVLVMRDAMVDVERAAMSKDARSGLHALKACWEAAKELFADDPESRASCHDRLGGIRADLDAGRFGEAIQTAEYVRHQLQQLALMIAASGNLPECLEELRQVSAVMTRFDFYVGRLCQATYDQASPDVAMMFGCEASVEDAFLWGMRFILKEALSGECAKEDMPASLLDEKAARDEESAAVVTLTGGLIDRWLSDGGWAKLGRAAAKEARPRIDLLTYRLVGAIEKVYPRPMGAIPPGHYSLVARFVFAAGLQLAARYPRRAQKLVEEKY